MSTLDYAEPTMRDVFTDSVTRALDADSALALVLADISEEGRALLNNALAGTGRVYVRLSERANRCPVATGPGLHTIRTGAEGVVLAVGPMLRPVLAATATLDVTVLYAATVRPFDAAMLYAAAREAVADVVLVEPYLRATSGHVITDALRDVPPSPTGPGNRARCRTACVRNSRRARGSTRARSERTRRTYS